MNYPDLSISLIKKNSSNSIVCKQQSEYHTNQWRIAMPLLTDLIAQGSGKDARWREVEKLLQEHT